MTIRIKNMTRLYILLLGWTMALSFTACYKSGGVLTVIDDPPVVEIDTTVITYATNLKVGGLTIPADTVFGTALIDSSGPSNPLLYVLDFTVAGMPTFSFWWTSFNPNQSQLTEGSYQGIVIQTLRDSSISAVEAWILDGMDVFNYPFVDIDIFSAETVGITISDLVEDVRRDTLLSGEVMVVDRATVTLGGLLFDPNNGQQKAISGNFTCDFSRLE